MSFVELVMEQFKESAGFDPRDFPDGAHIADIVGGDTIEKMGHLIEGTMNGLLALATALDNG
jgi:hypothetical protein